MLGTLLAAAALSAAPETWFHVIGGNASREGLAADVAALAEAGVGGIQFFHGHADGRLWPGVTNPIPCLGAQWLDLMKFAEGECHRRGLTFKMQNCPGWSMSGGPWITPAQAMRKLVAFEPGKEPRFDADDDYREIGTVTFPVAAGETDDGIVRSVVVAAPSCFNHYWAYQPDITFHLWQGAREIASWSCPQGTWADTWGDNRTMTFDLTRYGTFKTGELKLTAEARHPFNADSFKPVFSSARRLDNWEAKAGLSVRAFTMGTNGAPWSAVGTKTLVFGHVNAKRKNHPAPPEATGWECDKMDPRGFEANFAGYLGRALAAGVKIDGTLVDSWECGAQSWTWKMESAFAHRAGYPLRPWLPALFGYVVRGPAATERFLLDWRKVTSALVEENYYGTIARLAHAHGMRVQYESAFGDVITGDLLKYWKYADEPMCEFWSPHDDSNGFVSSYDFKPVLPCVSAAHLYGKRRVSAESLTSFELTFDENFRDWKRIVDLHLGRGVTHVVFHTYTHNPVVNGKPPSTSFGSKIGSPFLREQPWWPYLKDFTAYLARCGAELERGHPVVDILMYLGDDLNHKPSERELLFGNRYKYDYLNNDVLMNGLAAKDGRLVLPDGMSYRVIWIPAGTFLLPETERRLAELAAQGARIVRGDFTPDWPSPLEEIGRRAEDLAAWYARRDGEEMICFLMDKADVTRLVHVKGAETWVVDPVTGWREEGRARVVSTVALDLAPCAAYPAWATERTYSAAFSSPEAASGGVTLDLGEVRDWATVFVNGREVRRLWCAPYACEIGPYLKKGVNAIRVEVTSTWYNRLVHDAGLPEAERATWTLCGPKADAPLHPSGLLGSSAIYVNRAIPMGEDKQ